LICALQWREIMTRGTRVLLQGFHGLVAMARRLRITVNRWHGWAVSERKVNNVGGRGRRRRRRERRRDHFGRGCSCNMQDVPP
jgi:hypothetical protein